ncbi:MAG: alpha/beta hydrolase [Deltaproteobacteria bacterium]|nr:alpha/beta hydrolase [Deltaproteobacteria bacterium]
MIVPIESLEIHVLEPEPTGKERPPSLLFIHGAGGEAGIWDHQAAYFRGTHLVYRIDLPGHGGSSPSGEESIPAYARWVRKTIARALPDRPFVLVGHSMGGAIVQELARKAPPHLKGVVLVGTGAKLGVMPEVFEMLTKEPETFFGTIDVAAFHPDTPEDIKKPFIRAMHKCPLAIIYGDFKACDQFDNREGLQDIRLPVLILCGERDKLTPVKYAKYLHANLPSSRIEIIPGAGHMVMIEQSAAVNRSLGTFLDEIGG